MKLDEYYPTQSELEILQKFSGEMADWIGPHAVVIEPGCGNCQKVRYLLKELKDPIAYVGSDISSEFYIA